mmetsp:Transcript_4922/g.15624  ORF Transcript_4922/g.15624 Transcript_4922/m.15624 type:complete len:213 (-) Transcript_4922:337-975(-)
MGTVEEAGGTGVPILDPTWSSTPSINCSAICKVFFAPLKNSRDTIAKSSEKPEPGSASSRSRLTPLWKSAGVWVTSFSPRSNKSLALSPPRLILAVRPSTSASSSPSSSTAPAAAAAAAAPAVAAAAAAAAVTGPARSSWAWSSSLEAPTLCFSCSRPKYTRQKASSDMCEGQSSKRSWSRAGIAWMIFRACLLWCSLSGGTGSPRCCSTRA